MLADDPAEKACWRDAMLDAHEQRSTPPGLDVASDVALQTGIEELGVEPAEDISHERTPQEEHEALMTLIFEEKATQRGAERDQVRQSYVTGIAPPASMQRGLDGRYAVSGGPVRVLHGASSSV